MKQVCKFEISTVKISGSWRLEREPFVDTFRLHYEGDVWSVRPSSLLSGYITKMTFGALGLSRHIPVTLRR